MKHLPFMSRRALLGGLGNGAAGAVLMGLPTSVAQAAGAQNIGVPGALHHPPKAKRVISLFMAGGPSQFETFDPKPTLSRLHGQELPLSVRGSQRLTGMSGNQATLPLAGSPFSSARHGRAGAWVSEIMPHTARVVDDLCIVRSMFTEAINHDPAITFLQTGAQQSGRPSLGAWLDYGLGTQNKNLPSFVVLITRGRVDQPLYARLWGSGFLPSAHQGVQFRAGRDPVLFLSNPDGVSEQSRGLMLDRLADLHRHAASVEADPTVEARVNQYEMARRMQSSVPEVMDLSKESPASLALYGPDVQKPGSFASHCLLARRLAERGVRFIQLYHQGWDNHGGLPVGIRRQCLDTDQPAAALITDLKQRGLLDDTLVVWGGEFGRTAYSQGKLLPQDFGRDHHPRCFSMWMAGGGIKAGHVHGETDDFGYNVIRDGVHVHDLHATLLHLLGIDHERLTFRFQGRRFRLTDVHGQVMRGLCA